MLKALRLSIQISFSISVNFFIYFIKQIPGLGKKLPDSMYKLAKVKFVFSILVEIIKLIFGIFTAALAVGIFMVGPMYLMDQNLANIQLFYHYFFFFTFVIGPVATNIIFQTKDIMAFTLVNVIRLDKRDFYLAKILFTLGKKAFRYLLLMPFLRVFIDISLTESLLLAGYIVLVALIWEYGILVIFNKSGLNIFAKPLLPGVVLAAGLILSYTLPLTGIILRLDGILSNGFVFSALALLAGFSLWRLYSFGNYSKVTRSMLTREELYANTETMKNFAFIDVNLEEKKLVQENITGAENLQAYDLFNHLFFARHRRIILKPALNRVLIISVAALILWGLLLLRPDLHENAREMLPSLSPYMIFIMYMLSTGERFSRALFFNCDRYMLKEVYYKDKEAMLKNFTVRLKKSITLNLLPAVAMALLVVGTGLVSRMGSQILSWFPLSSPFFLWRCSLQPTICLPTTFSSPIQWI